MTAPKDIAPPDVLAIWQRATPLDRAPLKFGDPVQVKEFLSLQPKEHPALAFIHSLTNATSEGRTFDAALQEASRTVNAGGDIRAKLDQAFLVRLARGEFVALGFAVPRKPSDAPCRVPPDMLTWPKLILSRALAEADGLRIESIRVLPVTQVGAEESENSKPGRPSERGLIKTAYDACQRAKLIDFTKPQLRAIEAIQAWLQRERPIDYGEGRGFGHEAIRNVIADDFRAKAHRKQ